MFSYYLVRFCLLSGHLLGNNCSLGLPYVLFLPCLFVIIVFSVLVLRAGFGLWLPQFLIFAYSLLSVPKRLKPSQSSATLEICSLTEMVVSWLRSRAAN